MQRAALFFATALPGCVLPVASADYACRSDDDCARTLGYVCMLAPAEDVPRCASPGAVPGGARIGQRYEDDAGAPPLNDAGHDVEDGGAHEGEDAGAALPDAGASDAGDEEDDDAGVGIDAGPALFPGGYAGRITVVVREQAVPGSEPLLDFPLYLVLANEALRDESQGGLVRSSGGDDIELRLPSGGERLAHELEEYSPASGELALWVRVPSLSATGDTTLHLYFGSDEVDDVREQPALVWDEHYRAVWHLDEPAAHDDVVEDSTGVNDGSARNTESNDASDAIAGGGMGFGNPDEAVRVVSSDLDFSSTITVEAWARLEAGGGGGYPRIYQKGTQSARAVELFVQDTFFEFGTVRFRTSFNVDGLSPGYQIPGFQYGQWHHYVGIFDDDDDEIRIYVDGQLVLSEIQDRDVETGFSTHWIGNWDEYQFQGRNWAGAIDELRVSSAARSSAWIAASYANQDEPSLFYDVGSVEIP